LAKSQWASQNWELLPMTYADWEALKKCFPRQTRITGLIERLRKNSNNRIPVDWYDGTGWESTISAANQRLLKLNAPYKFFNSHEGHYGVKPTRKHFVEIYSLKDRLSIQSPSPQSGFPNGFNIVGTCSISEDLKDIKLRIWAPLSSVGIYELQRALNSGTVSPEAAVLKTVPGKAEVEIEVKLPKEG